MSKEDSPELSKRQVDEVNEIQDQMRDKTGQIRGWLTKNIDFDKFYELHLISQVSTKDLSKNRLDDPKIFENIIRSMMFELFFIQLDRIKKLPEIVMHRLKIFSIDAKSVEVEMCWQDDTIVQKYTVELNRKYSVDLKISKEMVNQAPAGYFEFNYFNKKINTQGGTLYEHMY